MLIGRRILHDPTTIGLKNGLSYVAAATYAAPPDGQNKKDPYVAAQPISTSEGRRNALIVDSPQSQSNRVEERLYRIFSDNAQLLYPRISITFPDGTVLTNWQLSHRSADQMLRLTDYFDDPKRRYAARAAFLSPYDNLTWFVEHFPIDVILGTWHSHVGPTVKLPRLLSATMIGYTPLVQHGDTPNNRLVRAATKIDPLITGSAEVLRTETPNGPFPEAITGFKFDSKKNIKDEDKLSGAGLGDIIGASHNSSTFAVEYVEQRVSLALAPLRNARFPLADGKMTDQRNTAGRAVLEALGKIAFKAALEIDGMLRSGCLLSPIPGKNTSFGVNRDGSEEALELPTMDDLINTYEQATQTAVACGFSFENVIAKPSDALVKLYEERMKSFNRLDETKTAERGKRDAA